MSTIEGFFSQRLLFTFYKFHLFTMSENQDLPEPNNTPTNSPANTGKATSGKKLKTPKRAYGKMRVSLLVDHEHILRIASVILERNGEDIHTPQQLVDLAMDRFMDYLKIKKGIDAQELFSKKPIPSK